jgi:hypothetical protein
MVERAGNGLKFPRGMNDAAILSNYGSCGWRLKNSHVTTASWWTWEPRGTSFDYFFSLCDNNVVGSKSYE